MNKYEQLIEYIINEQEDKARELFHNIVVEKSRDIYESLMDDDQVEENIDQYDQQGDLADSIQADETNGLGEDDEEMGEIELDGGDDMGDMDDMGGDDMGDMGGEEGGVEEKFQDIKSAIDDLQAEFDKLMGGDEGGSEEMGNEGGEEPAFGESIEEVEEAEEIEEAVGSGSGKSGSGKSGSGKSGSGKSGSGKAMSEAEMMREYVEKIAAPSNTEGADNKGSVVAGKNDMGGTVANIAKGGSNSAPDGTSAPKSEKAKEIASGNINVPGGKAGNAFKTKEKAKTGEEGGVNDNSPLAK